MMKFKQLRWTMLVLFIAGVTLNYVTRNTLGVLAPELKQIFNISTQEYSWIVASFQFAYTIAQPFCGWILDYIGLKIGFLFFALIWAIVCMLHPLATSWVGLAVLRFFMGGTEAVATPANVKILTDWFPAKERAVAAGWSGVGFSFGAMLAPPLVVAIHLNFGWQAAFFVTGLMGLLWAGIWKFYYYHPSEHPMISSEEKAYILGDRTGKQEKLKMNLWDSFKSICRVKKFYGIAIPAFLAEPSWQTFSFFVPLYLATERGMNLKEIAMFAWLPFLAADIGSALSGYLAKGYMKHFHFSNNNATIWSSVSGAFLMISLAMVPFVDSPYAVIALISIGGFGHAIISAMLGVLIMENFESDRVASVNGLRGFSAWTSGFLFSLLIGVVVPKSGYLPIFVSMGFFDLIGAVFMIGFIYDRSKKIIQG
ncbi:ACS family hexuronate transporter-like MFS transporter [Sporomusaceae bacterium BoRhaA]|uniref:MFS transporter n=1 Tax=Pelorhabdus rhamnosifermentans TaxID=2772457 RepID=UPI001C063B99|nr:MFS transporter [Pelorhabdus rhamnosifermentans]MBU2700794.1 ACS family hexuronate transporter-like MFS transporter [Pelorhabdus rhamnosifermentans]